MKISFVTSGFPNGFTEEFATEIKKHLVQQGHFVFVASDFQAHDKTVWYCNHFLDAFKQKGIVFEAAQVIDFEITPEAAKEHIQKADIVWLAGGPVLTQIAHIKEYDLIGALRGRDGITIGMSAGSINMARRVVLARDLNDNVPDLSVYEGIGLVDFNIEPHFNTAAPQHIEDIQEAAALVPIYALHDEAFVKDIDGNHTFFGQYQVFDERKTADAHSH
ncbi:MAG: Type 1 glutamine amidotransferase-like domain-containing protein [Oscillospiraceae bacterium]|jgi:dipeptidase E|nr:Type 1 glutamine amidotransferase-like domain-containing protein [Oscillospiraceae bacterium]